MERCLRNRPPVRPFRCWRSQEGQNGLFRGPGWRNPGWNPPIQGVQVHTEDESKQVHTEDESKSQNGNSAIDMAGLSVEIEVRPSDIDYLGHVNNAAYFSYLEVARTKAFKEIFLSYLEQGLVFIVARAECDYHAAIRLFDRVVVDVSVGSIGQTIDSCISNVLKFPVEVLPHAPTGEPR